MVMRNQLAVLRLPLPSRRDEAGCEFVIPPSSSTVEQLLADIQKEDPAIEKLHLTVMIAQMVLLEGNSCSLRPLILAC